MPDMLTALRRRLLVGPLARQVMEEGLTYLSVTKMRRLESALGRIARDRVPGALAEFGVAAGGSAIVLARAALAQGRAFHGFDVFGMIPPPASEKDDDRSRERYAVIAAGGAEGIGGNDYYGYVEDLLGKVTASLARHGVTVDGERVFLHRGLFEDTLPGAPLGQVALAHLDCDWYDPVRYCLDAIADRIAPGGGTVILDDYNDYEGCRTAADEFLRERDDFARQDGRNLILIRRG